MRNINNLLIHAHLEYEYEMDGVEDGNAQAAWYCVVAQCPIEGDVKVEVGIKLNYWVDDDDIV